MTLWASAAKPRTPHWVALPILMPGRYCYEIYLLHWPLSVLLYQAGAFDNFREYPFYDLAAIVALVVIVVISAAFSRFVTEPIALLIASIPSRRAVAAV
jgi:peptidoglycan/LPS O-acetylase OafA/YrhL